MLFNLFIDCEMKMKQKPITPYARLLDEFKAFCDAIDYRSRITMFFFKKSSLKEGGWSMSEVYERTRAADTLGYDVVIEAADDGLRFKYVKKIPNRSWSAR